MILVGGRAKKSNSPGLKDVQASLRRSPIACQLLPSLPLDQLVIQNDGLLLPQQLQCFLVLLCQVLHTSKQDTCTSPEPSFGQMFLWICVWATNLCVIEVNRGYGETLFLIWWPLPHSYFCHLSIYVNKNVVWRLLKEFLSFSKYTCICRDHAHLILMQTESFYAINRPEIWEKWLSSEKSIKGYSYYAFKRGKDLT